MNFSIQTLRQAYKERTLKPRDVVLEAYKKIERKAPVWISLADQGRALERVAAMDSRLPLFGIPFAVKDNIDVAGMLTTAGCPVYAYTPARSATVVERLENAGAILIGKTNLDQFATGLVGVRSPYGVCSSVFDSRYISGGSSAGSAVAVALEQVSFALGTDTAGSGRVPAAFNELIGLKPTRGVVSAAGVVPACRTLDCVSVFTKDASGAASVLASARGLDARDSFTRVPGIGAGAAPWLGSKVRFGVPRAELLEFFGDAEAARLYATSIERMREVGGEPVEIDFRPFRDAANLLYSGPWVAERLSAIRKFLETNASDVHPVVRKIIEGGARYSAVDCYEGYYKLAELRRAAELEWAKMDILLLPTTGTIYKIAEVEANPFQLNTNLGYYTNFVNLLDLAAVAVPGGRRSNGLPFGVSLIGPAFSDSGLLGLAARLEGGHTDDTPGCVRVAVVGAHLEGQPLNGQLTSKGARLVKTCRTASDYRLYALKNTDPPKPGLVREPGFAGPGIEIEIWAVPEDKFGRFVVEIPPPLGIGNVVTDTGDTVKAFLCEPYAVAGSLDITSFRGWRNWLASQHKI